MMQIVDTTDGRYKGKLFSGEDKIIELDSDVVVSVERILKVSGDMWRFASANYVIDAKEV